MKRLFGSGTAFVAVLAAPSLAFASDELSIVVKKGDTLFTLAKQYNTTVGEIKKINGLQSDLIYIGQTLKIKNSTDKNKTSNEQSTIIGNTATVNTNGYNLLFRSGPGTNYGVLDRIPDQTKINVLAFENENWAKVEYKNKIGFVHRSYITLDNEKKPIKENNLNIKAYVDTGNSTLNFRTGPGTNHQIIERLKNNTEILILSYVNKEWAKIKVGNKDGFVHRNYIKLLEEKDLNIEAIVNTGSKHLFFRSGPGTNYTAIDRLKSGTVLSILSYVNDNWAKVKVDSREGYVSRKFIKLVGNENNNGNNENDNVHTYENTFAKVRPSGLNVRSGSGIENDVLFVLRKDSEVQILSHGEGSWVKISYEGKEGFVNSSYLTDFYQLIDGKVIPIIGEEIKVLRVISGDTLTSIAEKYNTTIESIKLLNNLNSDTIYIDQELKIDISNTPKIFSMPTEGTLTSSYGPRWGRTHHGIDIAKNGDVEVKAAADGTVIRSQIWGTYGETVLIRHEINGQIYETVYAHLRTDSRTVNVGDKVSKGEVIGMMGATGNATGQHLHFEVHIGEYLNGSTNSANPLFFIKDVPF